MPAFFMRSAAAMLACIVSCTQTTWLLSLVPALRIPLLFPASYTQRDSLRKILKRKTLQEYPCRVF
jgi:hypothetical protein